MPRTREQDRLYQRERYRRRRAAELAASAPTPIRAVPSLPQAQPDPDGSAVELVAAELAEYPRAPKSLRAAARAMARILDDPSAVPQHAPAVSRLQSVMAEVRAGSAPKSATGLAGMRAARGAS